MKLSIALAQINTALGNVQRNLDKHIAYIDQANASGADVVIFPELSLTGYVLQDLAPTVACRPRADDPNFRPLLEASRKLDIVVSFVEEDIRSRFYISAAYLSQGEVLHVHRKVYLPTYGLFDESRFFAWGDAVQAFDTRFGRVGILICEDFWHASPPYLLWLDGADLFFFMSASPGRGLTDQPMLESARWVNRILRSYSSLYTSFVAHTNRVGFEDGLNFWGGAAAFDPNGDLIGQAPLHEEALTLVEMDLNQLHRTRARLPLLRDERTAMVQRELERILSNQSRNIGR
ncbi:MAG TPA: nitrilase-related carbon-nitrogen hydrolase [Anaerolineaceae bacterium]